jgi:hypothetical protein
MNDEQSAEILERDADGFTRLVERAVRLALEEHYRAGNPVSLRRDGELIEVPPEEIPAILAAYDEPGEQPPTEEKTEAAPRMPAKR